MNPHNSSLPCASNLVTALAKFPLRQSKRIGRFVGLNLLMILAWTTTAHAQFFNNDYGIYSANCALNFSEVAPPDNSPLTTEYMAFGVVFSNVCYNSGGPGATGPNVDSHHIGNFQTGGAEAATFSFMIKSVINAVAISLVHGFPNGTASFTARLAGVVVASATTQIGNTSKNYYGFAGITFDSFDVEIHSPTGNHAVLMDNLAFREGPALPFPRVPDTGSSAALLAVSCALLGIVAQRSRRTRARVSA